MCHEYQGGVRAGSGEERGYGRSEVGFGCRRALAVFEVLYIGCKILNEREKEGLTVLGNEALESESCSSMGKWRAVDVAGSYHPTSKVSSSSLAGMSNTLGSTHSV